MKIMYIHGLNSSGNGNTVQLLKKLLPDAEIIAPTYDGNHVNETIKIFQEVLKPIDVTDPDFILIGSSLGGFWTLYLKSFLKCKGIIINPVLMPSIQLQNKIMFSAVEQYEIIERNLNLFQQAPLHALLFMGDDVLNSFETQKKLLGTCKISMIQGGNHRISENEIGYLLNAIDDMSNTVTAGIQD